MSGIKLKSLLVMWPSCFVCLVVMALLFCNLSINSSVYGNTTDIFDYNNASYVNGHDPIDDLTDVESLRKNDTHIPHVTIMFDSSSFNGNKEGNEPTIEEIKSTIKESIVDDAIDEKPTTKKSAPDYVIDEEPTTKKSAPDDAKPSPKKTTPEDAKPSPKKTTPEDAKEDATPNNKRQSTADTVSGTKSKKTNKREEVSKINIAKAKDSISDEESKRIEEERLKLQAEARLRRRQKEREKESRLATKELLHAGSSEYCDWKTQPIAFIKGDVCGAYYKVLGINRKKSLFDKQDIKKAYRQKSLSVHPDKNPSEDASAAFKVVQDAYECLLDDECRVDYDNQLKIAEENVSQIRQTIKAKIARASVEAAGHIHYYLSIAANYIYQTGMDLWNIAGEWEVDWLGEPRPVGKVLMIATLVLKGRILLQLHALSYVVVRVNYELAKARGLL